MHIKLLWRATAIIIIIIISVIIISFLIGPGILQMSLNNYLLEQFSCRMKSKDHKYIIENGFEKQ